MPHTVTMANMVTRLRYVADAEDADNAADASMYVLLNAAYRELFRLVAIADPTRWYDTHNAMTTANVATLALPTDMHALRQVVVYFGATVVDVEGSVSITGGRPYALERTGDNEVWSYAQGEPWLEYEPPRYIEEGTNIRFVPPPDAVYGVMFRYVPVPADVGAGGSFEVWNGWDDWLVYRAALDYLTKEEQDTSGVATLLARAQASILPSAQRRDQGRPPRITDVRRERRDRRTIARRGYS